VNMNTTAWNVFELLGPVLLAGLSWLSVKAAQLISVKVKNEQLKAVLLRLDDVILAAVREAQQVLVDKLKATSADGALTPDQRTQAKQAAIDSAKSQLGATGLAEVGKTFGLESAAVDKLLSTRVEATVHRLKAQSRPTLGPGTAGDAVPFAA